ncbi:MAG: DUF421 domain-containing protein [Oscillospiraceae bacterium]|nr:DUF421 domain-containing protein [Oscillospiraceae bacterium]
MNEIYEEILRIFLGFFVLLILTRLIGKKQLGQLNIFTYITGIVIGSMAAEMIIHNDVKIITGILGMGIWTILIFIIEFVSLKSGKIRNVLDGQPAIVIKKGLIQYKELKKMRLNIDDLTMLLRTNNVFSIKDVNYAILEPNGDLSVLKIEGEQQITKKDMNVKLENIKNIPSEIIVDGKVVYKNLTELGKTEEWLNNELKVKNISSIKDVLYAELQSDGSLYIQEM